MIRIVLVLALAACAGTPEIGALEPRPRVAAAGLERLELKLGPAIADSFAIRSNATGTIGVRRWRQTLESGFRYAKGDSAVTPTRVVRIDRADLTLDPPEERVGLLASRSVVMAHGSHGSLHPGKAPPASYAHIEFEASLIDVASGDVLARAAGVVSSKRAGRTTDQMIELVRESVERLYARLLPELVQASTVR